MIDSPRRDARRRRRRANSAETRASLVPLVVTRFPFPRRNKKAALLSARVGNAKKVRAVRAKLRGLECRPFRSVAVLVLVITLPAQAGLLRRASPERQESWLALGVPSGLRDPGDPPVLYLSLVPSISGDC